MTKKEMRQHLIEWITEMLNNLSDQELKTTVKFSGVIVEGKRQQLEVFKSKINALNRKKLKLMFDRLTDLRRRGVNVSMHKDNF